MTLEVLVASMMQKDMSLHKRMNLYCDAIIANQCDSWGYCEERNDFGRVRMLSTATRGVGINRNLALALSAADIVLFADDDIQYYDGDLRGVREAFGELPEADIILFGLDMTKGGEIYEHRKEKIQRRRIWNSMHYGTCRMAVRRSALAKHSLRFSDQFGGGCRYSCGEDSLFIRECLRAGFKVYSHPYVLGRCAKDSSTWFKGFNDKFMFDKGAWLACAFPKAKHLLKWYYIRKFSARSGLSFKETAALMNKGIKAFSRLESYEDMQRNI